MLTYRYIVMGEGGRGRNSILSYVSNLFQDSSTSSIAGCGSVQGPLTPQYFNRSIGVLNLSLKRYNVKFNRS